MIVIHLRRGGSVYFRVGIASPGPPPPKKLYTVLGYLLTVIVTMYNVHVYVAVDGT